ncbi:hypothetical protein Tco_0859782 [Tanacetum coccineum]|uniref:Uncharacterized protein n=1 Tax=Tanacetum coccineum TaxID=301880 RepID=A0ABQ5BD16_9ASTR
MQNLKDISNPTTALDMALKLTAKAFQLNNSTSTNNNQRRNLVGQNAVQNQGIQNIGNQNGLSVISGIANQQGMEITKRGTVEQHSATVKETRAYHESLFHNLAADVEKVNSVNHKIKETNADLTTELARYKNKKSVLKLVKKLSKEKSTVSSLQEEKKKLKSDFKIRKDELLDKQIQLENKDKN